MDVSNIEKIWQKSLVRINFHWTWATGPLLKLLTDILSFIGFVRMDLLYHIEDKVQDATLSPFRVKHINNIKRVVLGSHY
jgi:hypothetical protein